MVKLTKIIMEKIMNIHFDTNYRNEDNTFTIPIDNYEFEIISKHSMRLEKHKLETNEWKVDNRAIYKRFRNGTLAERALEKLLGISFIDWGVGTSKEFSFPDIKQLGLGVKSKRKESNGWLVRAVNEPQIFCVVDVDEIRRTAVVDVKGWAYPDDINTNIDFNSVIYEISLNGKGKGNYYGQGLRTIDELAKIIEEK